ncbi:hypothetical protein DFJ74DRAFT_657400 [Hyaloraphidium curvatum]|nr:hypothetical protein DFJ74DRAFT_657400 [Hyaloraphidium curvatum]
MRAVVVREYVKAHPSLIGASSNESPIGAPTDPALLLPLKIESVPDPVCPPKGLLVDVKFVGLNYAEFLVVQGKHQHRPKVPFTPGGEWAGIVKELGSELQKNGGRDGDGEVWRVGDRVFGGAAHHAGCWSTVFAVDEVQKYRIFKLPPQLTLRQSVNVMANYSTAWAGLVLRGNIKKDDIVLIHAAAGGVGLSAIHVAKYFGSTVIATASTPAKRELCLKEGADYAIDYTKDKWWEEVNKIAKQKGRSAMKIGADLIYDPVALVNDSLRCCAFGARILLIGFVARDASVDPERVPTNRILVKQVSVIGVRAGENARQDPSVVPGQWTGIFKVFQETSSRPVIYPSVYKGLEEIPKGLVDLARRRTYGKAVVNVDPDYVDTAEDDKGKSRL